MYKNSSSTSCQAKYTKLRGVRVKQLGCFRCGRGAYSRGLVRRAGRGNYKKNVTITAVGKSKTKKIYRIKML